MLVLKTQPPHDPNACYLTIRGGYKVLIDKADLPLLRGFAWFRLRSSSSYYVVSRKIIKGKTYTIRMHRLLLNAPAFLKVHHINHNTFDNRRNNLRAITEREHRHFDGWHIFMK